MTSSYFPSALAACGGGWSLRDHRNVCWSRGSLVKCDSAVAMGADGAVRVLTSKGALGLLSGAGLPGSHERFNLGTLARGWLSQAFSLLLSLSTMCHCYYYLHSPRNGALGE